MSRLSSAFFASDGSGILQKSSISAFHLVDMLLDPGDTSKDSITDLTDIFMTDWVHDIQHQSVTQSGVQTYEALGDIVNMTTTKESTALRVGGVDLVLAAGKDHGDAAAIGRDFITLLLKGSPIINKRVVIYRCMHEGVFPIDGSGNYSGSVYTLFDGTIKDFSILESADTAQVNISLSSHWADFEKKTGRFTNSKSQNTTTRYKLEDLNGPTEVFTGDRGFEYASAMIGDIQWGPK